MSSEGNKKNNAGDTGGSQGGADKNQSKENEESPVSSVPAAREETASAESKTKAETVSRNNVKSQSEPTDATRETIDENKPTDDAKSAALSSNEEKTSSSAPDGPPNKKQKKSMADVSEARAVHVSKLIFFILHFGTQKLNVPKQRDGSVWIEDVLSCKLLKAFTPDEIKHVLKSDERFLCAEDPQSGKLKVSSHREKKVAAKEKQDLQPVSPETEQEPTVDKDDSDKPRDPDNPETLLKKFLQKKSVQNEKEDNIPEGELEDKAPKEDRKEDDDEPHEKNETFQDMLIGLYYTVQWLGDRPNIAKTLGVAAQSAVLFHGAEDVTYFAQNYLKELFIEDCNFFVLNCGMKKWRKESEFVFEELKSRSPSLLLLTDLDNANSGVASDIKRCIESLFVERQLVVVAATACNDSDVIMELRSLFKSVFVLPPPDEDDEEDRQQ